MTVEAFFNLFTKGIKALDRGQQIRSELIGHVNSLSSAIQLTGVFALKRLNDAVHAADRTKKLEILNLISATEIEEFNRMNGLCAVIHQAINALRHPSETHLNINWGQHADARKVLDTLSDAERGMQRLFTELLSISATQETDDIDNILRDRIQKLTKLNQQMADVTLALSKII